MLTEGPVQGYSSRCGQRRGLPGPRTPGWHLGAVRTPRKGGDADSLGGTVSCPVHPQRPPADRSSEDLLPAPDGHAEHGHLVARSPGHGRTATQHRGRGVG